MNGHRPRASPDAPGLADVVDRDHVWVAGESRGGPRLALEAPDRGLVVHELLRQQLDRDRAAERRVVGAPHRCHPAVGDPAHDPVAIRQPTSPSRAEPEWVSALIEYVLYPRPADPNPQHVRLRAGRLYSPAMPKVCHICAKGPSFGHSRSHSMVATNRRFEPNLQRVRIDDGGTPRRVYVCTRCLKAGKVTKAR